MPITPGTDQAESIPLSSLSAHPRNPRRGNIPAIAESLAINGQYRPIVVQLSTRFVLAGNHTAEAARRLGWTEIVGVWADVDDDEALRILLADNRTADLATYDQAALDAILAGIEADQLAGSGWEFRDDGSSVAGAVADPEDRPTLADRFLVPPFSVLDARSGVWQERKRRWLGLGIRSELGRDVDLTGLRQLAEASAAYDGKPVSDAPWTWGTSVFDPVLCELAYRWWCPPGGRVLDPYAGGSVRGIVASHLGRSYLGFDLSLAQVEANRAQLHLAAAPLPEWRVGDAGALLSDVSPGSFDFVFTCPPYFDLERYSDDPADLSNLSWDEFGERITGHLALAFRALADDRYAAVVIGDLRGSDHHLRGLPSLLAAAAREVGFTVENEAVLLTALTTVPMRTARAFEASRVLGRCHQMVAVFVKGDYRRAVAACGPVDVSGGLLAVDGLFAEFDPVLAAWTAFADQLGGAGAPPDMLRVVEAVGGAYLRWKKDRHPS